MAALAWLWDGLSRAASVACVLLLGSNMFGGAIANFTLAAMTAAAGVAMVWAAFKVVRRYRHAE